MIRRKPVPQDAARVFEGVLAERGLTRAALTPEQALDAWLAFGRVAFRVPRGGEVDGLLYQYGIYDFTGQPRFHLDLTRQFAVRGSDEFVQFHCDVQFDTRPGLAALGRHDEWWFSEEGNLDAWGAALRARPEWGVLASLAPVAVDVNVDET